mmetsp:Transcript_35785/g.60579  ORF Transcript_35785/g.60579 Transcript_35785/m.60579 type:complete len:109 (+) Transcript_35785:33-359(+)
MTFLRTGIIIIHLRIRSSVIPLDGKAGFSSIHAPFFEGRQTKELQYGPFDDGGATAAGRPAAGTPTQAPLPLATRSTTPPRPWRENTKFVETTKTKTKTTKTAVVKPP